MFFVPSFIPLYYVENEEVDQCSGINDTKVRERIVRKQSTEERKVGRGIDQNREMYYPLRLETKTP